MNIAVIFAGGIGTRMHSKDKPKQFLEIHEKPIIIRTLEKFNNHPEIGAIVVVCVDEWILYCKELIRAHGINKVTNIVPGGTTGQLSIYNGLLAAKEIEYNEDTIVLIHDGVRPLISQELITNNIKDVKTYGNSITCSEVKETIVEIDENGSVRWIPDRINSRVAKAPQCFYLQEVLNIHEKAMNESRHDFIDTCTMMNHYGVKLHMTDGPYDNIKITTPGDYYALRSILDAKENEQFINED